MGFYFAARTGLPLMQMYANSTTLHVGVSHPRADLPHVIDLVERDEFDPLKVATLIADWDDAPDAFTTRATKVIVRRKEFDRNASSLLRTRTRTAGTTENLYQSAGG